MKKLVSLFLAIIIMATVCGCGKDDKGGLYYDYDMTEYLTVGEYSKEVDTKSDYYITTVSQFYTNTFADKMVKAVTEGKVANGDTANIDFTGYMDGKEFEGGSAKGYELTIGSGSFIEGFEEGLIGVEIGSTVDLELKFPDPYPNNTDLSGKPVVFKVKVNSVKGYDLTADGVKEFGYNSVEEAEDAAHQYAVQCYIFESAYKAAKVTKYPEREVKALVDSEVNYYKTSITNNGSTFEEWLKSNNLTEESMRKELEENYIKPNMVFDMLCYYILQENDQKLTQADVDAKRKELEEQYNEKLGEELEISLQKVAAQEKAFKILEEQAVVK